MSADTLLSLLDKVRRTGPDQWMARCPAHNDITPSLSIRQTEEKTLIHCFSGCTVHEVVDAVGLELSDLFPSTVSRGKPDRRPFRAEDALRGIAFEALVVASAAVTLRTGTPLTSSDMERLSLATSRIQAALSAVLPPIKKVCHD